jgi:DNA polymerase-1
VVTRASEVAGALSGAGVGRGDPVAVALAPGVGVALAAPSGLTLSTAADEAAGAIRRVEDELRPRWVWWSGDTAAALVASGTRVAACWDVAAVHRLLFGGWRADPGRVWATLRHLPVEDLPAGRRRQPDLFSSMEDDGGSADEPVRPDGHLRPDWSGGGWATSAARLVRWAELAAMVARQQQELIASMPDHPRLAATARAESAAELLCAEMSADGLPLDRAAAEAIIEGFVGPRPRTEREAAEQRGRRDAEVLRHAPAGSDFDLRSPGQVKSLLRRIGVEVPDTRAWRLEARRDEHPLVDALLTWRKAERVSTTFGYGWLDEHLGGDGRLRGDWSGSDGAAGRMTASAGLHNMPADLRGGVAAEDGHVLVRADLGQIEPRVLAAVSGDRDLARATAEDDMYSPVARQLDVDRATAKVAVLGAMYGQTTGHGAHALRRLQMAYPVAMAYLDDADRAGQTSRDLRTYGGRLIPMGSTNANEVSDTVARSRAAARGRYGRNAMVQGAAAELFKLWAVTVRARGAALDARIVLCLHDELLVHTPDEHGETVARLLDDCLQEAAHRWAPDRSVRFVADISVIRRWSEAKD